MKINATCLITLLITAACVSYSQTTTPGGTPQSYKLPEAYEVYSAIIPSEWPVTEAHAENLVIRRQTVKYETCLKPDEASSKLIGSAIDDYSKQNELSWELQRNLNVEISYELVDADMISAIFKDGALLKRRGWEVFYDRYPKSGGYVSVSAVGFNADKTIAVVYMDHHCGLLCGGGGFHVLEKKDGKWQPLKWNGTGCLWMS